MKWNFNCLKEFNNFGGIGFVDSFVWSSLESKTLVSKID